jgi:hypothetical protein
MRCAAALGINSNKEVNDMKSPKNLGMLLLAIWLIATGILQLVSISIPGIGIILAVLAIAAGVLILLGR